MKVKNALAAAAAMLALAACEVPEDGGKTAADRADVNQKSGKKDQKKESVNSGPEETTAQANARESAETYLDTAAFSRSGLIEQLEFEGYSTKDATYGVDAQGVDWNKQAAASAETYLEVSSFSRAGLIEQLTFEGFTPQQAAFGAKAVGL